jgi:hypothetical protein
MIWGVETNKRVSIYAIFAYPSHPLYEQISNASARIER